MWRTMWLFFYYIANEIYISSRFLWLKGIDDVRYKYSNMLYLLSCLFFSTWYLKLKIIKSLSYNKIVYIYIERKIATHRYYRCARNFFLNASRPLVSIFNLVLLVEFVCTSVYKNIIIQFAKKGNIFKGQFKLVFDKHMLIIYIVKYFTII